MNFFCILTCTFGAPPYFKSWIHPCSKSTHALKHSIMSCPSILQPSPPPPAPESKKEPFTNFSFSFQLFIQLFSFLFHPFPVTHGPGLADLQLPGPHHKEASKTWWVGLGSRGRGAGHGCPPSAFFFFFWNHFRLRKFPTRSGQRLNSTRSHTPIGSSIAAAEIKHP